MTIPALRLKVPGPSRRYVPEAQAERPLLMLDTDVPAATVDPHCVLVVGIAAPAFCQFTARLGLIMPDHGCCEKEMPENESNESEAQKINRNRRKCKILISYNSIKYMSSR
jgi:hypothetical protein